MTTKNKMSFRNVLQTSIKFILIFFILIFIYQCKNSNKKEGYKRTKCGGIILHATVNNDSLSFNEIIDTFKLIRLETTPNSLFGDITKLEILNDTIIIFDIKNQLVFTFDLDGNFLGKIGTIGKGPNEILAIRNIAIDKIKQQVLIFDDKNSKVLHFKLDGKFIFVEDAKLYPYDFIAKNNKLYYFQNKSSFFFDEEIKFDLLITKNGKIIRKYFQFPQTLSFRYPLNRVFYELNDTICYVDKWNSRIFSIVNDEIQQRYCIDFNGNEIPLEYTEDEKIFDSKYKKYAYLFDYVVENKSYIYFRYFWKGDLRRVIYKKNEKSYCTFSTDSDESDILAFSFAPIYSYNDFFVSEIPPFLLIDAANRNILNNNELEEEVAKIEQSDNLLLAFYKLRK